jgi:hypothetical protein
MDSISYKASSIAYEIGDGTIIADFGKLFRGSLVLGFLHYTGPKSLVGPDTNEVDGLIGNLSS